MGLQSAQLHYIYITLRISRVSGECSGVLCGVRTDLRKPSGLARRSFDVKNMSKNQQSTSITVDQSGPHNVQSGNTECVKCLSVHHVNETATQHLIL